METTRSLKTKPENLLEQTLMNKNSGNLIMKKEWNKE